MRDKKKPNIYMSLYCSLIVTAICCSFILPNLYWMALSVGSISTLAYIQKRLKYKSIILIALLLSLILLITITQRLFLAGENYLDSNKVGFVLSMMTGYFLSQNALSASLTRYIPISLVLLIYLISFAIGIDPSSIHPVNSENFVFVPVLISLIYLLSFGYVPGFYNRLMLGIPILVVALISTSRSGILLALILNLILISPPKFRRSTLVYLMAFILLVGYVIFSSGFLDIFLTFELAEKFSERGLTSFSRLIMWEGYKLKVFENVNYLVYGIDLSLIPELHRFALNPHNSFLGMHSSVGAVISLFFISMVLIAVKRVYISNHYMHIAILCLLLRSGVDINIIYGRSDFVLFFMVFLYLECTLDNKSIVLRARSEKNI